MPHLLRRESQVSLPELFVKSTRLENGEVGDSVEERRVKLKAKLSREVDDARRKLSLAQV
jgi:hypothetical protein